MSLTCDAIIFDLDGVLVDSNGIAERHLRAWTELHSVSFEHIASLHHGRTTVETIRLVAPYLDAKVQADLLEGAEAVDTDGLMAFTGAARLLACLPPERWASRRAERDRPQRFGSRMLGCLFRMFWSPLTMLPLENRPPSRTCWRRDALA